MPPVMIRVLSWNVESFAEAKGLVPGVDPAVASELINFIALVVRTRHAHVVGLMELKAGFGDQVSQWLVAELNNGRSVHAARRWRSVVSSRQDGGTQEEYAVLYREEAGVLTLDDDGVPAPASLLGVLDSAPLQWLYDKKGWAPKQREAFVAALKQDGYAVSGSYNVTKSRTAKTLWPRVKGDGWQELHEMATPEVELAAPPGALSAAECQRIADTLLNVDILRFTENADRSPYLVNFKVGTQKLAVALYHAPGPSDLRRFDAINIIALSRPAAYAPNLLLMGDFNIAGTELAKSGQVYSRAERKGTFTFDKAPGLRQVFAPITGPPLNAADLLPGVRTSLVNAYLADGTTLDSTRANTFDKFFFKGAPLTAAAARVVDLVDIIDPTSANHDVAVARSAFSFYRQFRGTTALNTTDMELAATAAGLSTALAKNANVRAAVQSNIDGHGAPTPKNLVNRMAGLLYELTDLTQKQTAVLAQRNAIAAVSALVTNPAVTMPTGVGSAHAMYRHAVSDHLPITVEVTAP
jgi:hypothetical protein